MVHASDNTNVVTKGDKIIARLVKSPYVPQITFVLAYLEAIFSPILAEAYLLVVLAYEKKYSWKLLSLLAALGSSLGAMTMYLIGKTMYGKYGENILDLLHGQGLASKAEKLYEENAFFTQLIVSFTPLPDKVFSFLSGAFAISPIIIFTATFIGRLIRASIVSYISYEYGDEARAYIKKHTKTAAVILIIAIFLYFGYQHFS